MRLGLGLTLSRGRASAPAPGPTNTVAPVVSGTPIIGQTLTTTDGTWTGNGTITYARQWLRNGSPISGATGTTYTLVAADDLTTVSCRITATDLDGSRVATSNGLAVTFAAPVNTVAPVASGSTALGSVLTTTNGTWTGSNLTFAYQWQRNGVNISGATANTYTIVVADSAANLRCVVTASNSGGSVPANSNAITAQTFTAPNITGVPTISGTAAIGQTLTASPASVTGNPSPTRAWQWLRSGSPISGATSATYTIVAADGGNTLSVRQTETNALGSVNATSTATATVPPLAAPVITGVPTISGTTTVGQTLTASPASVTGNPTPSRTWQWRRDGVDISGATSSTYLLVSADAGTVITVRQTETNSEGTANATSAGTAPIASGSYSPAVLFQSSEPGFWAPVTTARMWQDVARTTPVTATGQTVASWELTTASGVIYATQSNASQRPAYQLDGALPYLQFDGSDDNLVVTGINLSGTDKLTVIVGVEKSNNTVGIVFGYGANPLTTTGAAGLYLNGYISGDFTVIARQSLQNARRTGNLGTVVRRVATQRVDFAQTEVVNALTMRLNKADQTLTSAAGGNMGSGNFGNHTLTIGRREEGGQFPLNGRIYGMIFRGALTSGTDLTDPEDWMNGLTGAY